MRIGKMLKAGVLTFVEKVFHSKGKISRRGEETTFFLYREARCAEPKRVSCPNTNTGGVNPTHILELGIKIGKMAKEGKLTFIKKVFLSDGMVNDEDGHIAVFIYQVRNDGRK
ncbi:MAG: hypothetical protein QMD77_00875 [Patescibacteria group bacterium]|nr:hypothetical protein [Patescibacteria group bacterium]